MLKLNSLMSLVFCIGAVCAMSNTASAQGQGIYDDGHGDIGVAYEGGELELHWHIEGGTVDGVVQADTEYEANELRAVTSLLLTGGRPAGDAWDPIGNSAGDAVWWLPQSSLSGTPFIGMASEEAGPASDWVGDLTWSATLLSGPGEFSLWQTVGATPTFQVSSADGISTWTKAVGGHDHFNYGFTELGDYEIEFTVSGTHVDDGDKSDTRTFSFSAVSAVPEPSSAVLIASLGIAGFLRRRR